MFNKNFSTPWTAENLFMNLNKSKINLKKSEQTDLEPMFWHSLCTEYDARNFYSYYCRKNLPHFSKMENFLSNWLYDEINHANAFKIIYNKIYNEPINLIDKRLIMRRIDFDSIDEFFINIYSVAMLLAYDELITTHVYHHSINFYEKLGAPIFGEFVRRLKYDEAQHFKKIMTIVKIGFSNKPQLAESILRRILEIDFSMENYYGTFVLDHACSEFPLSKEKIENLCEKMILKKVN